MKLIPKLFIKNYQDINDTKVRLDYGVMCGVFGVITNFIICLGKIIIGILLNAISIIADGIDNLTDILSSLITIIGFKLSKKKPTKEHPFGHERVEYIAGLIISLIIIGIGLVLLQSSINKLIKWEKLEVDTKFFVIAISVLSGALILKITQSLFYRKYGKLIDSTTIIATSYDSLNDCISNLAVILVLIGARVYPTPFLDGCMGIVVSFFILINGIKLVKKTISPLIGEAPSSDFIEKITTKILEYKGVLGLHDLIIHNYGPKKTFVTVHVEVDSKVNINYTHDVIDNIERDFLNELGVNLVIHMDPIDIFDDDCIYLRNEIAEIIKEIDPNLTFHDFRIVKGETHTNMIFDLVVYNNCKYSNDQLQKLFDLEINRIKFHNALYAVITYDIDYTGGKI